MVVTNQNCIHEEIMNRLNLRNACYHAVQNLQLKLLVIQFSSSSLNVFDDGAVLLGSVVCTRSIALMFFLNHNISRDGSSLVLR
jgi:hypothetical protein